MPQAIRCTQGGITLELPPIELHFVLQLLAQVHELLALDEPESEPDSLAQLVGIGTATTLPEDPALARLLPDAHPNDPVAAAEFRRYTELGLRQRKRDGLAASRAALDRPHPVELATEQAQTLLVALTDVRLVLASRMGLESEADHDRIAAQVQAEADFAPDEPGGSQLGFLSAMYDFLTWLQEGLVQALARTAG